MQAGLGGCPSCALLRQRTIYPASVTALPNPVLRVAAACSSTGQRGKMWHGANNNGHSRWDRRESFWNKWERRSQQHFWQEVALEEDKRSEAWRSPIKSKVSADECTLALEREEYEYESIVDFGSQKLVVDQVLQLDRSMNISDENSDAAEDKNNRSPVTACAEELRARQRVSAKGGYDPLSGNGDVDARRRAELLQVVDKLGLSAFEFLETEAEAKAGNKLPAMDALEDDIALQREKKLATISMCPGFYDSLKVRESERLKSGQYFAYVLHTRLVTKVLAGGKRRSYSVLAVVGNGEGSAGFALGKDLEATHALVKAVHNAKKNLVHIERFDGRTIFHEHEETFIKTKLVIKQRRANSGTRCNWLMWKVLSAFGITDVSVKVHGSHNNISQTHAIFNALQRMQTAQKVADRRGKRVLDMMPRSQRGRAGYESELGFQAD